MSSRAIPTKEDVVNKLRHVPKIALVDFLGAVYHNSHAQLSDDLETLRMGRSRNDPLIRVKTLSKEKIITLLGWKNNGLVDVKEVNNLFEEWAYTKKPKIFFSEIICENQIIFEKFESALKETFLEMNQVSVTDTPLYANFAFRKIIQKEGYYEATFSYSHRLDYIAVDDSPKSIYLSKRGVIWVSSSKKTGIIKVNSSEVNILLLNKRLLDFGDKNTVETKDIKEKIENLDKEIDQEVYRLYGLTDKEIELIEKS